MDFLAYQIPNQDEPVIVNGQNLPPDSVRSCELAVECWHLRKTVAELEDANKNLKSEMKVQKHVVKRMQEGIHALQKECAAKDKEIIAITKQLEGLEKRAHDAQLTKNCMISTYSKAEQAVKELERKYAHQELLSATLKSQIAHMEKVWSEKYYAMEGALTLDVTEAEEEARHLQGELAVDRRKLEIAEARCDVLEKMVEQLQTELSLLQRSNLNLQDRCTWGGELEQAYETLHSKMEKVMSERDATMKRVRELEKDKARIYSFALAEGIQIPTFADKTVEDGDDDDEDKEGEDEDQMR